MGKIKKHNHWVPRFYLKYFSIQETFDTKNPQIWCFSNKKGDPFQTGIRQVANKNYLYSPKDRDGNRSQKAEDLLENVEAFISRIWYDLATHDVKFGIDYIKDTISIFLASLHLRNIKQFEFQNKSIKRYIELIEKVPKDNEGIPLIESIQVNNRSIDFDYDEFKRLKTESAEVAHEEFVNKIFSDTFELAKFLAKKKWTIISSPTPSFITTDNPLVVHHSEISECKLTTDGAKILFPVSPKYILMLHTDNQILDGQYYTAEYPEVINHLLWRNTHEFMFSPRSIYSVLAEMDYISRLSNSFT